MIFSLSLFTQCPLCIYDEPVNNVLNTILCIILLVTGTYFLHLGHLDVVKFFSEELNVDIEQVHWWSKCTLGVVHSRRLLCEPHNEMFATAEIQRCV